MRKISPVEISACILKHIFDGDFGCEERPAGQEERMVSVTLVNEAGEIQNTVSEDYPLYFPQPGWSEQDPTDWWNACVT